jgi:hypothetical protein
VISYNVVNAFMLGVRLGYGFEDMNTVVWKSHVVIRTDSVCGPPLLFCGDGNTLLVSILKCIPGCSVQEDLCTLKGNQSLEYTDL